MQQQTDGARRRRPRRVYSAREKAQAVLALWSGRRNPSRLARELEVTWAALNQWEQQALAGMLTALDPGWKQAAAEQPNLPPRLEKLITQTLSPAAPAGS